MSGLGKRFQARSAGWSGSIVSVFGEDPVVQGIIRKMVGTRHLRSRQGGEARLTLVSQPPPPGGGGN